MTLTSPESDLLVSMLMAGNSPEDTAGFADLSIPILHMRKLRLQEVEPRTHQEVTEWDSHWGLASRVAALSCL